MCKCGLFNSRTLWAGNFLCISFWNFIKKIFPPSCLPCWLVRLLSLFYETALVHIVAIYLPIFRLTKAKSSSFSNFRRNSRRICKIPNKEVGKHQLPNYDQCPLFHFFFLLHHLQFDLIFENLSLKLFPEIKLDERGRLFRTWFLLPV